MLPPPPPVPAAPRVPYARVTALKTALLRRLLPPLACLGRPPSGAALRSAVAPHKGQVQSLAWTPRGGGGGAAQRRGRVPDGRQDLHASWRFLASRLGRRSRAQYRKTSSSDLRQGRLSELLRKGQLLPQRGVAGARGWLNAGQAHVLRAAEPAAAAAWTMAGAWTPLGRLRGALLWPAAPLPPPRRAQELGRADDDTRGLWRRRASLASSRPAHGQHQGIGCLETKNPQLGTAAAALGAWRLHR